MHCKQMRAKKGNESPKGRTCPSHSALSARLRWTQFLLQWLQRPLGYTECPHFDPDSPVAEHNASNVTCQQRRGFHPTCHMHCKQMRGKKGNEPHIVELVLDTALSLPSPMDPILLHWLQRPLGVHRMPSLQPRLPRWQSTKLQMSPVSSAEVFTLPATCIASK